MMQIPVQNNIVQQDPSTQAVSQTPVQPVDQNQQVQQQVQQPVNPVQDKTQIQKFRDMGFSSEDIQTHYKTKIQETFLDRGFSGADINQFLKSKGYSDDDIKEMTSKLSPYDRSQIRGNFDSLKPTIQAAFTDADEGEMNSYLENVIGVKDAAERKSLIKELAPEIGKDFNTIRKEAREKFKGDTKEETKYIREELAKSSGKPVDSWEAFRRYFIRPANEAAQKISVGARSLAADAYNYLGETSLDTNEALDLERKEVAWREQNFKDKFGNIPNIPKKVVEALPEVASLVSSGGLGYMTVSAFALGYGQARAEGKDKSDAAMQGTVAAAIPGVLGAAQFTKNYGRKLLNYTPIGFVVNTVKKYMDKIVNTPEVNKELIKAFNIKAKEDKLELLKFADQEGVNLALPQLVNSSVIDQLTKVMSRSSAVQGIFKDMIKSESKVIESAWNRRVNSLSDKDVAGSKASVELGSSISDTFKKAQQARKDEYTTTYNKFKELGDKEFFSDSMKFDLKNSLEKMKQSSDTTNDSKSIRAFANQLLNKIDDAKTITDLDLIRKKAAEELRKPGLKEVYRSYVKSMHETIDNSLASNASEDAYKLLKQARGLVAQERNLYGKQSSYNTIKNAVSDKSYKADVVRNFFSGGRAIENIKLLKQEAERVGDDSIVKDLLKRYVEEASNTYKGVKSEAVQSIRESTEADLSKLLKTYSKLDKDIIKELGGADMAADMKKLASLAKSFKDFDKLTTTQPLTGIVSNPLSYLSEVVVSGLKGRAVAKLLTNPVFMKTAIAMGERPMATKDLIKLTKEASKKLGFEVPDFKPAPASDNLGAKNIKIYQNFSNKRGEYSLKKSRSQKFAQIDEKTVNTGDLATKDTLESIAKQAGKKNINIKDKRVVNELKARDFKGYIDGDKVILFDW